MNRRAIVSSLGALLFSAVAAIGVSRLSSRRAGAHHGKLRAVSLSPALTETLLALGAGDALVGVSDFCELPQGRELPRVGSSLTPHYEAITALHPSLILCDDSVGAKRRELSALAPTEFLPWLTLPEVLASTRRLGRLLAKQPQADALAQRLEQRLSQAAPAGAPRVLLLLGYDPARPSELWFIKRNSLHGAALGAAGGRNAVDRDVPGPPRLGVEELLQLDPDLVILLPTAGARSPSVPELIGAFAALAPLRAVREQRVGALFSSHSVGPGILELADALEREIARLAPRRAAASGLPR